jgi:transcriptional regulator with XRE-family HTH domain
MRQAQPLPSLKPALESGALLRAFLALDSEQPVKGKETQGQRLARLRKAAGVTQSELAKAIGTSQRMIAYYEKHSLELPARLLPQMAKTLGVTVDQLVGAEPVKAVSPQEGRLLRKLKEVNRLPAKDQKAVIYYIEALLTKQASN